MEKNWIEYYDNMAKIHKDSISQAGYLIDGTPIEDIIFNKWFEQIQSKFEVNNTHTLIDVGCGSGIFLDFFSQITSKIYATDPAQGQIDNTQQKYPFVHFKKSEAIEIPFENILFDRIFCNGVFLLFENLQYAEKTLENFLEKSTPNAKIWIGEIPRISHLVDENYQRVGKSSPLILQHYPETFFMDFCIKRGLKGEKITQEVTEKATASIRYDFLISK